MTHYDADAITRFAVDRRAPGFEDFERHVAECGECLADFEAAVVIEAALADKTTWQIAETLARPVAPPRWLTERAARRERERVDADEALGPILTSPAMFEQAQVEDLRQFHSISVVEALTRSSEVLRPSQPSFAVAVAATAVAIVGRMRASGIVVPGVVAGRASAEHGFALLTLSRYRESEQAFLRAQHEFEQDPQVTPHDQAIVSLNRAIIYLETERVEEAEQFTRVATPLFEAAGDGTRLLNAMLMRGGILYMRKEYASAAALFEQVIPKARVQDKTVVLARALHNAALCHSEIGAWETAQRYFFECLVLWDELGDAANSIRVSWALASIVLRSGRAREAIPRLRDAVSRLEAIGIVNDAALAKLELAEALLADGQFRDVPAVLSNVAVNFASDAMNSNAKLALAYLHEAMQGGVTHELIPVVRHVRAYLDVLPADPKRRWAALR